MDASNILKPALAAGKLRCIGSTTYQEFRSAIERDRALARRFQKIDVGEPSVDDTIEILKGLKGPLRGAPQRSRYTDGAIEAAAKLAAVHINERCLPDKAIDVIDEAGARERLQPAGERTNIVDEEAIEKVISHMAGVPIKRVSTSDKDRLRNLESRAARAHLRPGRGACNSIVSAIKLSRAGLRAADKPIGSFLFSGPTGVGKTELAKQLANALGVPFLRYDMSEYSRAPHGLAPDRRAARLRRLRSGRTAHRRHPQASALGARARRDREGAPGAVQHPAAGDGPRHAHRQQRAQGRLPQRRS